MIGELVSEGRTVFLSSHLLDEVEKTCEAAAIIDRGRIIAEGRMGELVRGERSELEIGVDDPALAIALLEDHHLVSAARFDDGAVRVTLRGSDGAAAINADLINAGIAVSRLAPVRESLEHRFLEMTSRLGVQA
jgi:ABC-2 type transport system ATP-binding protein